MIGVESPHRISNLGGLIKGIFKRPSIKYVQRERERERGGRVVDIA